MRQIYQSRFPSVPEDFWLPQVYDNAVIGMVERINSLAPLYHYGNMLNCVAAASAEDRFKRVLEDLSTQDKVTVMYTPAQDKFWDRVRKKEILAFELLSPAIKGMAGQGANAPTAVVYDKLRVLGLLSDAVVSSDVEDLSPEQIAQSDYNSKLLACNAGDRTPWYFFT